MLASIFKQTGWKFNTNATAKIAYPMDNQKGAPITYIFIMVFQVQFDDSNQIVN